VRPKDKIFNVPTTREVLETTIELEKRSMALYARFAKVFAAKPGLHEFWFGMAVMRPVMSARSIWSRPFSNSRCARQASPIPVKADAIDHLRILLDHYIREPAETLSSNAHSPSPGSRGTELEDMVGDLLRALQQRDEYERCQRLLVHDLGD